MAVDDPSAEPPMAAQHRWIGEDRARHHAVAWHAMPLLSFVLAVHGEQGYLEECAASILGPGVDDVELVAIDDASPDHAPALLDRLAASDPRVRVEHLAERAGPGPARNLG